MGGTGWEGVSKTHHLSQALEEKDLPAGRTEKGRCCRQREQQGQEV